MARRRKAPPRPLPANWKITTEYTAIATNGRELELIGGKTLVGIKGQPGRYMFHKHVVNTDNGAEWIDVCGGVARGTDRAVVMFRSFRPDLVTRTYEDITKLRKKQKGKR